MPKKLKVAFAMGGGVSLGTFSGAALTETIKHLIVGAKNDKGEDYESVSVDVLSGASAGAISLGIMARVMLNYDDKIHLLVKLDKYTDLSSKSKLETKKGIISEIEKSLRERFDQYGGLSPEKKKQLITTQVAQDFQELIWVKSVNINKLIEFNGEGDSMIDRGSLLNRSALESLAKEIIYPEAEFKFDQKSPLASRVLFACTLTRLHAEKMSSASSYKSSRFNKTLNEYQEILNLVGKDGVTSKNHKDVRVFDLETDSNITDFSDRPSRWYRGINGNTTDDTIDVKSEKFWKIVTATTLACGAFPFAFEQVPLKRKSFELSNETEEVKDQIFSYVDGGTLNNEPIREAFRLSSYLDSKDPDQDFDRIVIFIDPFITHLPESKNKPFYRQYAVSSENGKYQKLPGLSKMLNSAGPMLRLLINQSTISELDKAIAVNKKFDNRDKLRLFYNDTVKLGFPADWTSLPGENKVLIINRIKEVKNEIDKTISDLQKRITIPNSFAIIRNEFRKMVIEDNNRFFSKEFRTFVLMKLSSDENILAQELDAGQFVKNNPKQIQDLVKAFYFLMIDISMDLVGKTDKSILVPIGPLVFQKDGPPRPIDLKGQPLSGFLGFFSENYRKADFDTGILCSYNILCTLGLIGECSLDESQNDFILKLEDFKDIEEEAENVVTTRIYDQLIKDNVRRVLDLSGPKFSVGGNFSDFVLKLFTQFSKGQVRKLVKHITHPKRHSQTYEIWIKVPDKSYSVDDNTSSIELKSNDVNAFEMEAHCNIMACNGPHIILTEDIEYKNYEWHWKNSVYVNDDAIVIEIHKIISDKRIMELPLMDASKLFNETKDKQYPVMYIDLSELKEEEAEYNLSQADDFYSRNWEVFEMIDAFDETILEP